MPHDARSTTDLLTNFDVGTVLPEAKKMITRDMIWRYGNMVEGERRNPIHYDRQAAANAGYRDIVAHGALLLGFVSRIFTEALGVGWLARSKLTAKFIGPVVAGDEITAHGVLRERAADGSRTRFVFDFRCENQWGQEVVVGTATVHAESA